MSPLVRRYLKTAIVFLLAGLMSGGVLLVRRELGGVYPSLTLASAHAHVILVGFVMMMILGVAQWMFPRPPTDDARDRARAAELAYWVLTIATALRFAAELARTGTEAGIVRASVVAGGLGQIGGLALFFYGLWPRIRTAGTRSRTDQP
jgi:heme/copper-type cytochrome/quinol oxidase subunit 1